MAKAPEAADVFETLNVLLNGAAKLTFDDVVVVEEIGDPGQLVVGELASPLIGVDFRAEADLSGEGRADAVEIAQRNLSSLIGGNIDSQESWHDLSLSLLVARIGANDDQVSLASNDFAILADTANAATNFHGWLHRAKKEKQRHFGAQFFQKGWCTKSPRRGQKKSSGESILRLRGRRPRRFASIHRIYWQGLGRAVQAAFL
jgi:hypothetical protein